MPTELSIKNVPDDIVRRLRIQAAAHHRTLQSELIAILEQASQKQTRPLSAGLDMSLLNGEERPILSNLSRA